MSNIYESITLDLDKITDEYVRRIAAATDELMDEKLASIGYVKVVRCRDCKYFEQNYTDGTYFDETVCWSWDNGHDYPHFTYPNGFCHRGERRDA